MGKHFGKTPEGKLVGSVNFMHNTVTNDQHKLEQIGVKTPKLKEMWAYARNPLQKTELWFRTPQRLEAWQQHTDMTGWLVKVVGAYPRKQQHQVTGEDLEQ